MEVKTAFTNRNLPSPQKRRLKCDTKHQSQEADATFIISDGSKPYKPWRTLDTDDDNNQPSYDITPDRKPHRVYHGLRVLRQRRHLDRAGSTGKVGCRTITLLGVVWHEVWVFFCKK